MRTLVSSAHGPEHSDNLGIMLRCAVSLATAAIVIALPASAGDAPRFKWDVPKATASVPVSDNLQALGVPLRVMAVRSDASAEALFDHFMAEFKKANLFIPPRPSQFMAEGGVSITALDTKRLVSYTVIFQPNPDKSTTVILGEADLSKRQAVAPASGAPVFPAARQVLVSRDESTIVTTYSVDAKPEEVAQFYTTTLTRAGYEQQGDVFENGSETVRVQAKTGHKEGELFVVVETRKFAPPPPPGPKQ
jgi:hypothetical protein